MRAHGVLLDLEGVIYQNDAPLPGARQAIEELVRRGVAVRYLTNTTVRPRREVGERLRRMGFEIHTAHIFTPALAARALLVEAGIRRMRLVAPASLAEDFADFELVDDGDAQAVVMGDVHRDFDWQLLNDVFVRVRAGARLVALHKNRYCRRGEHNALDLGPFVAAIEYATDTEATLVGKPSAAFFRLALADLGVPAEQAIMVGDDIVADIGGGRMPASVLSR